MPIEQNAEAHVPSFPPQLHRHKVIRRFVVGMLIVCFAYYLWWSSSPIRARRALRKAGRLASVPCNLKGTS